MRRYLMLFSALAGVVSNELFRNKDDVSVYIDAHNGDAKAIANLKGLGCDNEMPIHCAAQFGNAKAIAKLKAVGADVNTPEEDRTIRNHGRTPVFIAAEFGHAETIAALKDADANVNTPEKMDGATPVYIAARNGHAAAITALLNAGADASIGRRTPESWAQDILILVSLFDTTSQLLAFHALYALSLAIADISPWGRNTPLKIARQGKRAEHQEVVRLLEMHFQQYPNGFKVVERHNSPMLTQFHLSKHIPEANAESTTAPDKKHKKASNFREL